MKTILFYLPFQPIHTKYQGIKKIPYNPFGLYGISSIYLLQIILLPQNQQYLCMSNLRERVANIAETRK
jgi:hypothetical protein